MTTKRRTYSGGDRRRLARGGRRTVDCLGRYPSVLVADSDKSARRIFADHLRRFRFSVAEAVDGEDLMARIVIAPPRIILTDARLPNLPPNRLVQWLRDSVWTRHIPVIVMAHDTDAELAAHAPRTTGVLVKPVSLDAMLNEVRRLLRIEIAERNLPDTVGTGR